MIAAIRLRPDRTRGATLAIALTGLRADETRTTAIAGAVAVPVAVATLLSGFLVAIDHGVANVAQAQADGRLVATTTRFTDWGSVDARFSPDTIAKLSSLPGVDAVEKLAEIEITLPNGSLAYVRAEDRPTFSFPVLAGQAPKTSVDADQLVIGGILARENGIRVGDTLLLGSGPRARKIVVGTIVATPEVGGRRIQMRYRLADQIFGPEPADLVFVKPAAKSTLDQIAAEIKSSRFNQPIKVVDAAGYRAAVVKRRIPLSHTAKHTEIRSARDRVRIGVLDPAPSRNSAATRDSPDPGARRNPSQGLCRNDHRSRRRERSGRPTRRVAVHWDH